MTARHIFLWMTQHSGPSCCVLGRCTHILVDDPALWPKGRRFTKSNAQGQFFRYRPWVRNQTTHDVFPTQGRGSPLSKNCVYLIWCDVCGAQYVGETQNTLLTRFAQHRYNILREKDTHLPLVQHFTMHGLLSLYATSLHSNLRWSTASRSQVERLWIRRLGTVQCWASYFQNVIYFILLVTCI